VPPDEVSLYGIVKLKKGRVVDFVEKPKPEEAPSCLASLGRFILNWEIIDRLITQKNKKEKGQEFYLTEALAWYAQNGIVLAQEIEGKWLTTGDPLRYLKAIVELALSREDLGKDFKDFLRQLDV